MDNGEEEREGKWETNEEEGLKEKKRMVGRVRRERERGRI